MPDTNFDIGVSTVLRGFESSRLYKALLQGAIATKRIAAKVMICHSQGPECWHVEFADRRAHVSAMADDKLKCSFCGKRASEVERLIAGPRVYICDKCVDACIEILGSDHKWREHQIANLTRLRQQAGAK